MATQNSASQSVDSWSNISFENTLNYKLNIDRHNIDIVLGQTIEQNKFGEHLEASGNNLLFGDSWDHAYLDNAQIKKLADVSVGGHPTSDSSLASFFGRVNYNFNEKYMLQATVRTDGSSNFAKGHRWGIFPSASAGWVVTNEEFMESVKGIMDFFKIRASWDRTETATSPTSNT
ncbi:MAG: TonB-dependent receptor [Bacteroides graminisolvens]